MNMGDVKNISDISVKCKHNEKRNCYGATVTWVSDDPEGVVDDVSIIYPGSCFPCLLGKIKRLEDMLMF